MATLLYDVVLVGRKGEALKVLASGLDMTDAIEQCDNARGRTVITFTGTHLPKEATSVDSDASSEQDDSDATTGSQDAADGEYRLATFAVERADFIVERIRQHLKQIERSLPHVIDCGDLGIIAQSIKLLAYVLDDRSYDAFLDGFHGELRHDELEAALGMPVEEAAV